MTEHDYEIPSHDEATSHHPERVREEFDEFTLVDTTVVMISDPKNEHAWIQSNETVPVEP